MSSFPPVTFHITSNAPDGTSSFLKIPPPPTQQMGPSSQMTYLYSAPPHFSIKDNTDLEFHRTAPTSAPLRTFPPAGGIGTIILDVGPNTTGSPGNMHRTQTLDHCIMLSGELELTLSNGETKLIKAGDIVLQRACMHAWRNPSTTQSARMFAIAVGSEGAVEGAVEGYVQGPKQG